MTLNALFQRSVRQFGDRPALAVGAGPALTYAQLDRRIQSLAHWLRHDLRLASGDRIMLAMKNCSAYVELLLASWHAGLCVVPVNAKLHVNEIEYMLRDCGARVCMSHGALHAALQPLAAEGDLQVVDVDADGYRAACAGPMLPPMSIEPEALAWLFYTSGTTGRPKGVMLTHANMVSMAMHFLVDVQPVSTDDVLVHVAPLSHGSGLYSVPYFLKGALQVVPESGGLDEAELFGLLAALRNVSLFAAPTIVMRLLQHARQHEVTWPGLRCVLVGGAPFYAEDIKRAVAHFGNRIAQIYGQGESPMTISALSADILAQAVAVNDDDLLMSVGFAQTAVHISVVGDDGQPLPAGELGEVVVKAPTVMAGYWQNPEATRKTLADGALRTGDIGLMDERGLLHLKDRSKDVIISGGTNIYPREVEEVLLKHPAIEEVAVVGVPDPEWGESVAAFVVLRAGQRVSEQELGNLCIENIARFKRPKRYIFVGQLPKNGTGKVLKRELQKYPEAGLWQ